MDLRATATGATGRRGDAPAAPAVQTKACPESDRVPLKDRLLVECCPGLLGGARYWGKALGQPAKRHAECVGVSLGESTLLSYVGGGAVTMCRPRDRPSLAQSAQADLLRHARDTLTELQTYLGRALHPATHAELCAVSALHVLVEHLKGTVEWHRPGPCELIGDSSAQLVIERQGLQEDPRMASTIFDSDILSHITNTSPSDDVHHRVKGGARDSDACELPRRQHTSFLPAWRHVATGELVSSDNQYYVHPEKPFRLGWDTFATVVIWVIAIVIPVEVCFFALEADYPPGLIVFDALTDIFFAFDIVLNFFTAYHEGSGADGKLVTDFAGMGRHYLRGWFAVDALASFPWVTVIDACVEITEGGPGPGAEVLRKLQWVKVICMVKVLRVLKLGGMMQVVEEKMLSAQAMTVAFQLLKMTVVVLVMLHNMACFWYAAAVFQSEGMFTWLHPLGLESEDKLRQYTAAFYFAVTTGTTVGFGDITPQNTDERIVTTALLILSVVFVGQYLARFTTMISSLRKMETEKAQVKQDAIIFMKKRSVPRELQFKVLRYIENIYEEEAITALDHKVMSHLSESLQDQLALAVTGGVLRRFPFFKDADPDFLTAVCQACRTLRAAVGDIIVREDHPASEMYWMVRGEASVSRGGVHIGSLRAGDWFGEVSLFVSGTMRTATVRCETHCEFVVLNEKDFCKRVDLFPHVRLEYDRLSKAIREGSPCCLQRQISGCPAPPG